MGVELDSGELKRYSRHLLLPGFGTEGQFRLLRSSVLVVGLGQQGSAAAFYLAAAGVGRLALMEVEDKDEDVVRFPSCRRDLALVGTVRERLRALNPSVKLEVGQAGDMDGWIAKYDVIASCVRSGRWRQELNRSCISHRKPLVMAAVWGWEGQALTVLPGRGPCWNCAVRYDREEPLANAGGMMGAVAGAMGILQATEVVKILLGLGKPLNGRSVFFDGLTGRFHQAVCERDPECPVCSGEEGE